MELALIYGLLGGALAPLLLAFVGMAALVAVCKAISAAYRLLADFIDEVSKPR